MELQIDTGRPKKVISYNKQMEREVVYRLQCIDRDVSMLCGSINVVPLSSTSETW